MGYVSIILKVARGSTRFEKGEEKVSLEEGMRG